MEEWDRSLETGDPLVDEQHRLIYQISNALENAEDTPGEVMRVLDRLTSHVAAHFATEEALMVREEYEPHAAELHRIEHLRLNEETRAFVIRFREGTLTSTEPLVEFLRGWLSVHVEGSDRKLIDHVRARGGAAQPPETSSSTGPEDGLVPSA